jgi:hypothetical protein
LLQLYSKWEPSVLVSSVIAPKHSMGCGSGGTIIQNQNPELQAPRHPEIYLRCLRTSNHKAHFTRGLDVAKQYVGSIGIGNTYAIRFTLI